MYPRCCLRLVISLTPGVWRALWSLGAAFFSRSERKTETYLIFTGICTETRLNPAGAILVTTHYERIFLVENGLITVQQYHVPFIDEWKSHNRVFGHNAVTSTLKKKNTCGLRPVRYTCIACLSHFSIVKDAPLPRHLVKLFPPLSTSLSSQQLKDTPKQQKSNQRMIGQKGRLITKTSVKRVSYRLLMWEPLKLCSFFSTATEDGVWNSSTTLIRCSFGNGKLWGEATLSVYEIMLAWRVGGPNEFYLASKLL